MRKPAAGYTASKGAVAAMTKTVALDVAKQGIVANSICPGCKSLLGSLAPPRVTASQSPKPLCWTTPWEAPWMLERPFLPHYQEAGSAKRKIMLVPLSTWQVMMPHG